MALAGIYRCTSVFQTFRFSKHPVDFLTEKCIRNLQTPKVISVHSRFFTQEKPPPKTPGKPADPFAPPPKKRKPLTSPEITLISHDDNVSSTTLENAEKLAKRRNLKLIKIVDFDTKTERPVYKIMSPQEFFIEEAKTKEKKKKANAAFKDEKFYTMSSKIADYDMFSKVKQMKKALRKRHPVRAFISHDGNPTRADEVAKIIEEELAEVSSAKERVLKAQGTVKLHFNPKVESENDNATSNHKIKDTSKKEKKETKENENS